MTMDYIAPVEILLVEDSPSDIHLTRKALTSNKLKNNLHVVEDGDAALDFLYQRPPYEDAVQPDLILLDLNLPTLDGREVLAHIKADANLKHIPVVILTTSSAHDDIAKSYALHANCYVTKPLSLNQFVEVVKQIEGFWLSIVKLPTR